MQVVPAPNTDLKAKVNHSVAEAYKVNGTHGPPPPPVKVSTEVYKAW